MYSKTGVFEAVVAHSRYVDGLFSVSGRAGCGKPKAVELDSAFTTVVSYFKLSLRMEGKAQIHANLLISGRKGQSESLRSDTLEGKRKSGRVSRQDTRSRSVSEVIGV